MSGPPFSRGPSVPERLEDLADKCLSLRLDLDELRSQVIDTSREGHLFLTHAASMYAAILQSMLAEQQQQPPTGSSSSGLRVTPPHRSRSATLHDASTSPAGHIRPEHSPLALAVVPPRSLSQRSTTHGELMLQSASGTDPASSRRPSASGDRSGGGATGGDSLHDTTNGAADSYRSRGGSEGPGEESTERTDLIERLETEGSLTNLLTLIKHSEQLAGPSTGGTCTAPPSAGVSTLLTEGLIESALAGDGADPPSPAALGPPPPLGESPMLTTIAIPLTARAGMEATSEGNLVPGGGGAGTATKAAHPPTVGRPSAAPAPPPRLSVGRGLHTSLTIVPKGGASTSRPVGTEPRQTVIAASNALDWMAPSAADEATLPATVRAGLTSRNGARKDSPPPPLQVSATSMLPAISRPVLATTTFGAPLVPNENIILSDTSPHRALLASRASVRSKVATEPEQLVVTNGTAGGGGHFMSMLPSVHPGPPPSRGSLMSRETIGGAPADPGAPAARQAKLHDVWYIPAGANYRPPRDLNPETCPQLELDARCTSREGLAPVDGRGGGLEFLPISSIRSPRDVVVLAPRVISPSRSTALVLGSPSGAVSPGGALSPRSVMNTAPPASDQHMFFSHYGRRLKTNASVAFMSQARRGANDTTTPGDGAGGGIDNRSHTSRRSVREATQPKLKIVFTRVVGPPHSETKLAK